MVLGGLVREAVAVGGRLLRAGDCTAATLHGPAVGGIGRLRSHERSDMATERVRLSGAQESMLLTL